MDSTMMYLHVKKIGNESVDPVKNLPQGSLQRRCTTMGNTANTDMFVRQWQKPTLETNKHALKACNSKIA